MDVEKVTPKNIQAVVAAIRPHGTTGSFEFGTEHHPLSGKQCWIFILRFHDGQTWGVRVPVKSSHLPLPSVQSFIEYEVDILASLTRAHFSFSPELIHYDTSLDNAIKFPYLVYKWIEGAPLQWSNSVPESSLKRSKVLRRMVDFTLDLARLTVYDSGVPASQHLIQTLDRRIVRILNGKLPENKLHNCLVHRVLIRKLFEKIGDTSLCMISHDDLAPQNIIVDEGYDVMGVIDWGFAKHVPLPLGLVFPRFLSIEPDMTTEDSVLGDPQNFACEFLQPSTTLERDRAECISYLEALVKTKKDVISEYAIANLSRPQYDWHQLIMGAVYSKGLHGWLAKRQWLFTGSKDEWNDINKVQTLKELDDFAVGKVAQASQIGRQMAFERYKSESN